MRPKGTGLGVRTILVRALEEKTDLCFILEPNEDFVKSPFVGSCMRVSVWNWGGGKLWAELVEALVDLHVVPVKKQKVLVPQMIFQITWSH